MYCVYSELSSELNLESVPTSVHKDQRLETINTNYASVNDPRCTVADQDNTSKNDAAMVDNPAYSTSNGPPLIYNPAYVAVN